MTHLGLALSLSLSLSAAPAKPLRLCDDVLEPAGLDPFGMVVNKSDNILNQMFEGLVRLGPKGEIVPALAERWERLDDKSLRFHLRPGVRFHDGASVDAEAVRSSIERQKGAGGAGAMQVASIESVAAESTGDVVVRTHVPDGVLLYRLAAFGRVAHLTKTPDAATPPAGTGPYRFSRWDKQKRIVLKANEDYWGGKPAFPEVSFEFIPEGEQVKALERGEVDLVTELPGTRTLEIAKEKSLKVVKARVLATHAVWFIGYRGALADKKVRQALNYAVDKSALVRYAANGNGAPLASLSMPGQVGHNAALSPYPFDPVKAKKLLAEAGYSKGFSMRGIIISQSGREAKIIQAQLKKVGVRLELEILPISDVFRLVQAGKLHDYDLTANLAPDPAGHFYFLAGICYHSRSPFSGGGFPGFDERYEAMLGETDPDKNRHLAEELDAWVQDEALGIFTYQRTQTCGMKSTLRYEPSATGMLHVDEISEAAK